MSHHICFVNCSTYPTITASDQLVVTYLASKDAIVDVQSWDDEAVDWGQYDKLIIRATWNYHTEPDKFSSWLDKLESRGISVVNPPDILRWNMDKSYLRGLKDIAIPPTVWITAGDNVNLADLLKAQRWDKAVVKPCISATAMNTVSITPQSAQAHQSDFDNWTKTADYMVQVFMPQIIGQGEWSLMFFDKHYSHAVIKQAKAGDFRVQSDFGGQVIPMIPSDKLIQQAQKILDGIESSLTYARVDGIETDNGDFVLMELELIEPELFFTDVPSAARYFGDAILDLQ